MKKSIKNAFCFFIASAFTIASSAYCATGMALLQNENPNFPQNEAFPAMSALFSVIIDGEIAWSNIKAILEQEQEKLILKWVEDFLKKHDYMPTFSNENLIKQKDHFLQEFWQHAKNSQQNASSNDRVLSAIQKLTIQQKCDQKELSDNSPTLTEFVNIIKNKNILYQRSVWFLTITTIIGAFFCKLSGTQHLLLYLGMSGGIGCFALSVFIALLGAIGFAMMAHSTIRQMIEKNLLQIWWDKIKNFFSQQEMKKKIWAFLGAVFLMMLLSVSIICWGQTLWFAGIASLENICGINMWDTLCGASIGVFSVMCMIFYILNIVIFSAKNLGESIENFFSGKINLSSDFKKSIECILKPWLMLSEATDSEYKILKPVFFLLRTTAYLLQLSLNFFSYGLLLFVFLMHCVNLGLKANNTTWLPVWMSTFMVTVNDLIRDSHYFTKHTENTFIAKLCDICCFLPMMLNIVLHMASTGKNWNLAWKDTTKQLATGFKLFDFKKQQPQQNNAVKQSEAVIAPITIANGCVS